MRRPVGDPYYDVGLICLSGHVVNAASIDNPIANAKFCSKCGASTISQCQHCGTAIRGVRHVPGFGPNPYHLPSYCHECGQPYSWTTAALQVATEYAESLELSDADKEALEDSLPDLVKDTPRTNVAVVTFKRVMAKAGPLALDVLKDTLTSVLSETARKLLMP